MIERKGIIQFNGKEVSAVGLDLEPDSVVRDFWVLDQDWQEVQVLKETHGKLRILAAMPSLDTTVGEREARRFNEEAAQLKDDAVIVLISTDLPFAQARWCKACGSNRVRILSDYKYTDFGMKYSCLLSEPRILRSAVFIVDQQNVLRYADYMPTLNKEPNYKEVLRTAIVLSGKKN